MPDKHPSTLHRAPSSDATARKPLGGPVSALCPGAGAGVTAWFTGLPPLDAHSSWSICAWVRAEQLPRSPTILMGFGDGYAIAGAQRFFVVGEHGLRFWSGRDEVAVGGPLPLQRWHHLAACFDGQTLVCYRDGVHSGTASRLRLTRSAALIQLGPPPPWTYGASFRGRIMACTVWGGSLTLDEVGALAASTPSEASQASALALRPPAGETPDRVLIAPQVGQRGLQRPQDRATVPHPSREPLRLRRPKPLPPAATARSLLALDLTSPWRLCDATGSDGSGAAISRPEWNDDGWYAATVPGTALTTLIEQGVYPDPLHGRNNLLIPDDLARRNWWYRCEFTTSATQPFHFLELDGINYHAEVWLNGVKLGEITGAFIRGRFDVTALVRKDASNALAIRIWPPPHPGDPHEQSLLAGPGPNGGDMCYDGPTFFCTEGWDWLPGIRDRNCGVWQEVGLRSSGAAQLIDPQIVTTLPLLPDLSRAHATIRCEVRNLSAQKLAVVLTAAIGTRSVLELALELEPFELRKVELTPERFPQLVIQDPELWWPNGMGAATLHSLVLTVAQRDGVRLDQRTLRFGIREFSYEFAPHLLVVVNGRRVMCKGGNWGMDDALKRVSRERLEPYVRLHREANLNMIRNWCGQSTHQVFFDLCDEYGIMVWNDFWMTTEGFNVDPLDTQLFLANAEDAIRRHRNHACIAVWCGRNEGVPPPYLNEHLGRLLQELDGTRHYQPSSRRLDLMESGPWAYMEAHRYFTEHARGFNTELGLHSVPTAETMRGMLEPEDLWPPNDAWAYHDLHSISNGDAHSYLEAIASGYGNASGLDDFCRRAQMVNYVNHRAMFEAWNSRLFAPCSGLLLWMTHPSWPSVAWQIYAHSYSTYASFFAVKKACEPVHVQLNLPDGVVSVINHSHLPLRKHQVTVRLHALDGGELSCYQIPVEARAAGATALTPIDWPACDTTPVAFLLLSLADEHGTLLSENFYWHAPVHEDLQHLQNLASVQVVVTTAHSQPGLITVDLDNTSSSVALMTEITLIDAESGHAVLPAYASDNYVSLLPGTRRRLSVSCPLPLPTSCALRVAGWNIKHQTVPIANANAIANASPG